MRVSNEAWVQRCCVLVPDREITDAGVGHLHEGFHAADAQGVLDVNHRGNAARAIASGANLNGKLG